MDFRGEEERTVDGKIVADEPVSDGEGVTPAEAEATDVVRANQKVFNAQRNQCETVTPALTWSLVLDNMVTPEDMQNSASASLYFEDLLKKKVQATQLPRVLDILLKNGLLNDTSGNMNLADLLKLRLVSKSWRLALDSRFQQSAEANGWYLKDESSTYLYNRDFITYSNKPDEEDFIKKVLSHFPATPEDITANPFSIRSLYISNKELGPWTPNLLEFLSIYGAALKVLRIEVFSEAREIIPEYRRLLQLINLTPNITTFHLETLSFVSDEELGNVVFPHLIHLRSFMAYVSSTPISLINAVLRSNPQLRQLHVGGRVDLGGIHLNILQNLTRLELALDGDDHLFTATDILPLDVPEVIWPLEELFIERLHMSVEELARFFETLNRKWGTTLKRLYLFLTVDYDYADTDQIPPALPALQLDRLEEFQLMIYPYCSLDFLMPCKESLKEINLMLRACDTTEEVERIERVEETVKFISCADKPFESNVWNVFPALDTVSCEIKFSVESFKWRHTRREWREWKRNQHN